MTVYSLQREMLKMVARALGPELCRQVTFVGGCTLGLLLTDEFTREQVRHTEDVDLIVHVVGYGGYSKLQAQLRLQGFKDCAPTDEDFPVCAMKLDGLRVDLMPDDEEVLGFGNCWYKDAMATATTYLLDQGLPINLISPVHFVATKLEAYKGRGNGDPLSSRDIEDILNLIDGREELLEEIRAASATLQACIAEEVSKILQSRDFGYAVASQARGLPAREALLFERLDRMARGPASAV